MTEIVSLVTSIAACLSAIAALVVVRQNYKSRTASYKPELVLVRTTVKLASFEETGGLPMDATESGRLSIPVVNVGLGAATQLKVFWEFPIEDLVLLINRLAQESLTSMYFEYNGSFLSKRTDENQWAVRWENEAHMDFVLPALTDNARTELEVPLVYVALIHALYYFALKRREKKQEPATIDIPDVPPLECRFEYGDIGGARHSIGFLIHLTPIVFHTGGFEGFISGSRQKT